jgi:hypothetical protein
MRIVVWVVLAALAAAACGGSPAPAAVGGCTGSQHRASLAVTHLNGAGKTACVGFAGAQIAGVDMLKRSGVEFQTATQSWGLAICQVDNEPSRFSDCLPKGAPYWSIWISHPGQKWEESQVGIGKIDLADGEALGLRYVPQTAPPSPPAVRPTP